jgi:hypothetical protein
MELVITSPYQQNKGKNYPYTISILLTIKKTVQQFSSSIVFRLDLILDHSEVGV